MSSEVKKGLMRKQPFLVAPWCSLCLFVVSGESVWVCMVFPPRNHWLPLGNQLAALVHLILPYFIGCMWLSVSLN